MTDQRIVFMGTPEFAVATLNALVDTGKNVVGVVTAPDKPAGRGRQLRGSAVKERALELGLPLLQPVKLKDPEFLKALNALNADLNIVVAFRMLPEVVWNKPPHGTLNLHGSLLPNYRGAAPINWAVINGETETGVTTFKLQHAIDTGDILLQERIPIGPNETAGELHDKMMVVGADLVVHTVTDLFAGTLDPQPQKVTNPDLLLPANKIGPEQTRIDFNAPAKKVHDLIRGMSPFPGAWCKWEQGQVSMHFKLLGSALTGNACKETPGTTRIERNALFIACADEWIEATEVQAEGKRRMYAADLLRGSRSLEGIRFV